MGGENKEVKLSLTVMLNRERNKVLFAVADNHFVDILLSFLTLPLGRIVKVLKNHYGEKKAPTIGCLNTLCNSLANLNPSYFVTEAAKNTLLNPTSTFEAEYQKLKLDFTHSPKSEKSCEASSDGVFTKSRAFFLIKNDLQVIPQEAGFLKIVSILGITNTENSESIKVDFGFNEIMDLLKASLTSPTPLSDIILNKTTHMRMKMKMKMNTPLEGSQPKGNNPKYGNIFILRVMIQKSTGKLLHAQTDGDFVESLFSLLFVPIGGALEHLLAGKACFKAIYNLQRSAAELIDSDYFKDMEMKRRVTIPSLVHGCIQKKHFLPLAEECLPREYNGHRSLFYSNTFPEGKGRYLQRPQSYRVKDDLSVEPYCFVSILSSLREQKIEISDVEELDMMIGARKVLSILKASLTSTSALSDALSDVLLTHKSIKQPKRKL